MCNACSDYKRFREAQKNLSILIFPAILFSSSSGLHSGVEDKTFSIIDFGGSLVSKLHRELAGVFGRAAPGQANDSMMGALFASPSGKCAAVLVCSAAIFGADQVFKFSSFHGGSKSSSTSISLGQKQKLQTKPVGLPLRQYVPVVSKGASVSSKFSSKKNVEKSNKESETSKDVNGGGESKQSAPSQRSAGPKGDPGQEEFSPQPSGPVSSTSGDNEDVDDSSDEFEPGN